MILPLPEVVQQRIREAAKAHHEGHEVTFATEHGGAGVKLVALYRNTRHAVFTSGTNGAQFEDMKRQVNALFSAQVYRLLAGEQNGDKH
jgi:hypothetical protein